MLQINAKHIISTLFRQKLLKNETLISQNHFYCANDTHDNNFTRKMKV